ncbi:MAG TPA: tripartite tricarboxylate transporter TctB family protein [Burkholderiales bacterium]|nr:tripartite tricarboxylate transporter TctB family protein [Burkholderiales bacterium]
MEESPLWHRRHGAAVLELGIAVVVAIGTGYLAVAMPAFVHEGGIQEAQDFIRLTPVFFPRLSFGLTSVISWILVFRMLRAAPGAHVLQFSFRARDYANVLLMSALILGYAGLLPVLGYSLATMVAVAATTYFLGMRSLLPLLAFSVVTPVATRFIFERLLAISLPLCRYEPIAEVEQALMRFLATTLIPG